MPFVRPTLALLMATVGVVSAQAGDAVPALEDIVQVDLVPGWAESGGREVGALTVALAPGWKTYWRIGGDSGLPPSFDWSASTNLSTVDYHWPAPELFLQDGMHVLGFHDSLVLPITFVPVDASQPMQVRAVLDLGVCRDVCIPVRADIATDFAPDGANAAPMIAAALAAQPRDARLEGMGEATCSIAANGADIGINVRIAIATTGEAPTLIVIETPEPDLWISPALASRDSGTLVGETVAMNFTGRSITLDPADIRLTVVGAGPVVEFNGCAAD
jgi:DsbC/DsbD-like thiol-disulfide interchange protein